jgi:hypothetical protein
MHCAPDNPRDGNILLSRQRNHGRVYSLIEADGQANSLSIRFRSGHA